MNCRLRYIFTSMVLVFIAYIEIKKIMNFASSKNSLMSNVSYDYISLIKSVADQSPGAPLISFTNSAQKNFVKSFICNLVLLDNPSLPAQLVVVASDRETFLDLKSFNTDITVVLKPFQASKTDLT